MPTKSWIAVLICLACAWQEDSLCEHPARGESKPVDLDAVAKAQDEVKRRLAMSWEKSARLSADTPFDAGLPSCGARQTRRIKTTVPADLVGKTIAFAPADRLPAADVRVATSARRIIDVQADALSDPKLSERLGVRCSPTLVRVLSEVELELVENP